MGLSYFHANSKADWVDGQDDLSHSVAHLTLCWFCIAHIYVKHNFQIAVVVFRKYKGAWARIVIFMMLIYRRISK